MIGGARAATREVVWGQRVEITVVVFPPAVAAGRELPGLVVGLDAALWSATDLGLAQVRDSQDRQ